MHSHRYSFCMLLLLSLALIHKLCSPCKVASFLKLQHVSPPSALQSRISLAPVHPLTPTARDTRTAGFSDKAWDRGSTVPRVLRLAPPPPPKGPISHPCTTCITYQLQQQHSPPQSWALMEPLRFISSPTHTLRVWLFEL
ncbi:hypothetical protein PBY51_013914 [Eleginops maclovinus]|uniref:Secreted protein n=1 Tax=Eleginops maclovinus TaxID=56733 RepID=A0AAN7WU76_ELEMC|nr:hypothetical protein PBY51_013914 [Eleginops maclovinus]